MENIEILLVVRSLALQQGLGALLESLPDVGHVKAVTDLTGAYLWIEKHQPKVVVLDEELIDRNPEAVLNKIRALSPETQRALLVDDVQKVSLLLTNAEAIFIKGISPSAIASTVTTLLFLNGDKK